MGLEHDGHARVGQGVADLIGGAVVGELPNPGAVSLDRGFAEGAVVQARVYPRHLRFPTLAADGAVSWQELGFDCDPFLFLGRAQGAMVRVSSSPLSNVSTGGGVTGLLVLDDDAPDEAGISHV